MCELIILVINLQYIDLTQALALIKQIQLYYKQFICHIAISAFSYSRIKTMSFKACQKIQANLISRKAKQ